MSFHHAAHRKQFEIASANNYECEHKVRVKATRISLAIAAAVMISTPAFATDGDELTGLGVQSRALGGTGTAANYGSENALTNPSLLGKNQGTEFAIAGTLFMPDVEVKTNVASPPGSTASADSEADTNIIPEVSMYHRINNHWTFGLGMYGTAGMGVDYRDEDQLFQATSNLQIMKFVPALAYNNERYGFGFAPVIQYGALDINYVGDDDGNPTTPDTIGSGVSDDLGYGFNLGGHFDVNQALTLALSYQSAVENEYDEQITTAANGFGIGDCALCTQTITSNKLEQPAQFKVGAAYDMSTWMLTADVKQIQWGSAAGYEDFNWDDQMVYALGAKYKGNGYWAGFGFNYGEDPIDVLDNSSFPNQAINLFNNHFFPAIVEDHWTFGGGYNVSENMTVEGAVVYAPEVTKTIDTGLISGQLGGDPTLPADATTHEVKHSQTSITVALRMNF